MSTSDSNNHFLSQRQINTLINRVILSEIKRKDMPQLNSVSKLKERLEADNVLWTEERVELKHFKPVQEDYDKEKAEAIYKKCKDENSIKPLIVCEDYHILDGHHRATGFALNEDEGYKLPVVRIHLPLEEALGYFTDMTNLIDNDDDRDLVVVYGGRFQPFHKGHFGVYEHLVKRFGKNKVYVATSDKNTTHDSPFSFRQKRKIITRLFDVPKAHVVEVKNVYVPNEVFEQAGVSDDCVYVAALGDKDANRLSESSFFEPYDSDKKLKSKEDGAYTYVVPMQDEIKVEGKPISATHIRDAFRNPSISEDAKKNFFVKLYGSMNEEVYTLMDIVLNKKSDVMLPEAVIKSFLKNNRNVLSEATRSMSAAVDDGPTTWYGNPREYKEDVAPIVQRIGYEVLDYIMDDHPDDDDYEIKMDGLPYNSFYAVGVGGQPAVEDPDRIYRPFVEALSLILGYEIVNWTGITFTAGQEAEEAEAQSGRVKPEDAESEQRRRKVRGDNPFIPDDVEVSRAGENPTEDEHDFSELQHAKARAQTVAEHRQPINVIKVLSEMRKRD